MDFEPWWLIFIPVLFALGWLAARFDFRQMLRETRTLPDSYFRGLNFLLNEEPDRAIDAFVEVAKLDPETTELHFALGSLFRRRGEMERAIRVHQSLLNRADLPVDERDHAQHELAQDFLKAGMLDRAEHTFSTLKDTRYSLPALRSLVRIYESEHDWPRAIDVVKKLQGLVDEPVPQIVHYHCELAQAALLSKQPNLEAASAALDAADHTVKGFDASVSRGARVRIAILRAQMARIKQDPKGERLYLESIMTSAPEYAGLVAERLLANYTQTGEAAAGLDVLYRTYAQHASLDLFNVVFRELRAQQGAAPAWRFAREALRRHPSLLGLDKLLEAELATASATATPAAVESDAAPSDARRDDLIASGDLTLLRSLIHKHTQRLDRYVCRSCGFQPRSFYWQCPGCNSWETFAPRRLEELES